MKNALREHPYVTMLLLAAVMTLPWIFLGEFYTKGEPREACEALSMIRQGHWIVPVGYADEIGYKPPLMHWFIAGVSLLTGSVSEWTSRLPSALALFGLTVLFFDFLRKRTSLQTSMLAALLMLSSFEMHRNGLECRVDMTLAFFMAASMLTLYRWHEKGMKGFSYVSALLMACACLVKGPVGTILPVLIFALFALMRGAGFWKVVGKSALLVVVSLIPLLVWYYLAWKDQGDYFLSVVFAENIGRFAGMKDATLGIQYNLGHEGPFWYYLPALMAGLLPYSLVLPVAAVLFKWKSWWKSAQPTTLAFW